MLLENRLEIISEMTYTEAYIIYMVAKDSKTGKHYQSEACGDLTHFKIGIGRLICMAKINTQFIKDIRKNELRPKQKIFQEIEKELIRAKVDEKAIRIIKKKRLESEKLLNEMHIKLKQNYEILNSITRGDN